MKANGTVVYQRQHKRGLTMPQLSAIDLLASGKTDKETAVLLGLSRTCITKWRLYSPEFQATLNRRRAEVWGAGIDRLRSLVPKALDALAEELEKADGPSWLKAAVEVLKLAQLPDVWQQVGPMEAEAIVRQIVQARRAQTPGFLDQLADQGKDLPPFDQHMDDTWRELENHRPSGPVSGGLYSQASTRLRESIPWRFIREGRRFP
jgi:hypothetical protein